MKRVLIACECSGVVRRAFRDAGFDAWSCDIKPAEDGSEFHYQCDCREILRNDWDFLGTHPDCTFLTNSASWAFKDGPYHQKVKPGTLVGQARRDARKSALDLVQLLLDAPVQLIYRENPIGASRTEIRKPDQISHPWQFGDDASKATCLWLKGLPLLTQLEGEPVAPRYVEIDGKQVPRWGNQTDSGQNKLTPSDGRAAERSRTYEGIARAMVRCWEKALKGDA